MPGTTGQRTGVAASNAAKTHCPKGHPLFGDNLYIKPTVKGQGFERRCRKCKNAQERKRLAKRAGRKTPAISKPLFGL